MVEEVPVAPVTVQHLGPDEVERCKAIRLACLHDAPYAFGSTFEGESAQSDDWWRQRLLDGHWVVAQAGGADVAVAMLMYQRLPDSFESTLDAAGAPLAVMEPHREYPWIRAVWTCPEHRGQRLVDLLCLHLADIASASGAPDIVLGVRDGNDRAINAYARIGFEPVGRFFPAHAHITVANHLMRKVLV